MKLVQAQCSEYSTSNEFEWRTRSDHDLSREELEEGKIYHCSLYKGYECIANHCMFAIINGQLHINRASNWEEVEDDFIKESYMRHSVPCGGDVKCFKYFGELKN